MLQIAICDDKPQELEIINAHITKYLVAHSIEADVRLFSHPDKLLSIIKEENFHIYILDIVMPMVSGLELGKEIRSLDREAQIIYATTEPQFALQAYASSPINYLIKPINEQQLFETISLALSKIDLTDEKTFTVKTSDSLIVLKLSNILCCEYHSHAVIFTIIDGQQIVSRTIREKFSDYISPILNDINFLQCHSSYVVNMKRVERFAKDSFGLSSGKIIPIAAKQYPAVRDQYMDYLMKKEVHK